MTLTLALILDLHLGILKIYLHTKMKFAVEGIQKLEPECYRQTDTQTDRCD